MRMYLRHAVYHVSIVDTFVDEQRYLLYIRVRLSTTMIKKHKVFRDLGNFNYPIRLLQRLPLYFSLKETRRKLRDLSSYPERTPD